jgi:hypothetical protein
MPVSGGFLVLVQSVRIDEGDGRGELGGSLVMIDHDHVDAGGMGGGERLVGHCPTIDCNDEAGAFPP